MLWLINWIAAIAWASMSCAVAYWFTYDNAPGAEHKCCKTGTGFTRLASATWTITSKHLGSLAVGAFVIALCQTLRLGMKLLDSMTQQARGKSCMPKLALALALTLTLTLNLALTLNLTHTTTLQYIDSLNNIFTQFADEYAPDRKSPLRIIK